MRESWGDIHLLPCCFCHRSMYSFWGCYSVSLAIELADVAVNGVETHHDYRNRVVPQIEARSNDSVDFSAEM
jgi:hypothetical protein